MAKNPTVVSKDWKSLNDQLRDADEATCKSLFQAEFKAAKRMRYLLRIHSRLNAVRAATERDRIKTGASIF